MVTPCAFLLHEHLPNSYTFLGPYEVRDKNGVKDIEDAVLTHIKSMPRFQRLKWLEVAKPKIYLCSEPLQLETHDKVVGAANCGELQSKSFHLLQEYNTPKQMAHRDLIIVIKTSLHIKFGLLEQISESSYDSFGLGSAVAHVNDQAQTIYDAARSSIVRLLKHGQRTTPTIDGLILYELNGQFEDDHKKLSETVKLNPGLLGRDSATIHEGNTKLETIGTSNLIFVFTRPLRIPYALFKFESGSYQFVGANEVEKSSDDTVELLHKTILVNIKCIQPQDEEVRWNIVAYEPREVFGLAYNKQPNELGSLKLEGEHFPGTSCSILLPENKLSIWRGQALIVVFSRVKPPSLPVSTSLLDSLLHLHIAGDAPSTVAKLDNYHKSQLDPQKRILDDRPEKDKLIAPISLLYQPFGYFHDIRCGVEVNDGRNIHEGDLREKVNDLADAMTSLYKSEEARSSIFLEHLEYVFDLLPGSIHASKIRGKNKISDGHVNGAHGAMVFCVECKNELSAAVCEPTAQLVSYIAASLKCQANYQPYSELFQRWRVPILGVTQVGPHIQFFGVVWVGKMRVVPLTPPLPTVDPTGEGFRWDLFLAFKAASIVFHKIQTDVQNFIHVLEPPSKGWPPVLTTEDCRRPSVIEIDIEPNVSPCTQLKKVKFVLDSRYDNVEHRHLYHARLVSPALPKPAIYVKFSQRYSIDLHRFCASRGLAPEVLGFQRLSGGWFAVAMEKVNTVDPKTITSFPDACEWGRQFKKLVNDFHQEDLVHGDLRLANFVFTESSNPRRMMLVDFDWGGKEGEVAFPCELLNEELDVLNDRLYNRRITKEHDNRCLSRVLKCLDFFAFGDSGQVGLDTKPGQAMDG